MLMATMRQSAGCECEIVSLRSFSCELTLLMLFLTVALVHLVALISRRPPVSQNGHQPLARGDDGCLGIDRRHRLRREWRCSA